MNSIAQSFLQINEPYASGLFENPGASPFARYARAQRRYLECTPLHPWHGEPLYPSGPRYADDYCVRPEYAYTVCVDEEGLALKDPSAFQAMRDELAKLPGLSGEHTVGGAGYTHSMPNYGRITREGLNSYEARIVSLPGGDIREGLLDVLAGIRSFHSRALAMLRQSGADTALVQALEHVPFNPACSLYEAIVCWNFVYYLDLCDNPGPLDADLAPFYRGEDMTGVLRAFFQNVDINSGWSSALGPFYHALTVQCLNAAAGMRRPSLELRVTSSMPDDIWDAAARSLQSGSGQPAFYHEAGYQQALHDRFPDIPLTDLLRFNGGGCTETMLAGISNVGSLDAGVNLALVLSDCLQTHLTGARCFEDFYQAFMNEARDTVARTVESVSAYQQRRAAVRPQPMRTLLVDDCIDRGIDFNAGGARYAWSVINVAGLINVIESLLAIRELLFVRQALTPDQFLERLGRGDSAFAAMLDSCPHYGVDNPYADDLAAAAAQEIWQMFRPYTPWLGGAFLPASIQFATYAGAGRAVGPTPDGRRLGDPLCDSVSAIHGHDRKGPTAMLSSAARLHLDEALGTPVTNLRIQKEHVQKTLKPLVLGYFQKGGMQLQVTCVSRHDLLDARKNPDRHQNLIVRIGGYSEYFTRLSPELQQTVIDRTEF